MSYADRNPENDREATALLIAAVIQGAPMPMEEPNWLGHTKQAAAIDRALILGCDREILQQIRPSEAKHRNHLRSVHGIETEEVGGLVRFVRL